MNLREALVASEDFLAVYEKFEKATPRWRKYWFEAFMEIKETCAEVKKYFITNAKKMTITFKALINKEERILWDENILSTNTIKKIKGAELGYWVTFYDKNDNFICNKVGTTTQTVYTRCKQHLANDTYLNLNAYKVVIHGVWCGRIPAEGFESLVRGELIRRYPNAFKKNDRFFESAITLDEVKDILTSYNYPVVCLNEE